MKTTDKSTCGTSFFHTTISTSISKLRQLLGDPTHDNNNGDDKVNVEWNCVNNEGNVCTIYDWKEYRIISEDEIIDFHIGGYSASDTELGKDELLIQLANM